MVAQRIPEPYELPYRYRIWMRGVLHGCRDFRWVGAVACATMAGVLWSQWSHDIMTAKERLKSLIDAQPDDASYDEILRELAFERMVERGLSDSRTGRTISNDEMGKRIRQWQK